MQSQEQMLKRIPNFLKKNLKLSQTDFNLIQWVPILQQGWELDEWAALIEVNSQKILLHTNHGTIYRPEDPKKFLAAQIETYGMAANTCKSALTEL